MAHAFDDVTLDHPWVERYRIPLVGSAYPAWRYEVALVVPSSDPGEPLPDFNLYEATWPSEEEAAVVGSVIDFRRSYYGEHWQTKMLEERLDVDSGTNTLVLIRRQGGWGFRLSTWRYGPTFVFAEGRADRAGLISVLDRHWGEYAAWAAWKAAHADLFDMGREQTSTERR